MRKELLSTVEAVVSLLRKIPQAVFCLSNEALFMRPLVSEGVSRCDVHPMDILECSL